MQIFSWSEWNSHNNEIHIQSHWIAYINKRKKRKFSKNLQLFYINWIVFHLKFIECFSFYECIDRFVCICSFFFFSSDWSRVLFFPSHFANEELSYYCSFAHRNRIHFSHSSEFTMLLREKKPQPTSNTIKNKINNSNDYILCVCICCPWSERKPNRIFMWSDFMAEFCR